MNTLYKEYSKNVQALDAALRIKESFDLISRHLNVGDDEATFYYVLP